MFESLSERLHQTFQTLSGNRRITSNNIKGALKEVRKALLDSDVALPVVQQFVERVRQQAMGQQVASHLNPAQALLQLVRDELIQTLGAHSSALRLSVRPPAVILLAGLQGVGKTTTAAKLASYLARKHNKKVMLTSTDVWRPGAIDQLEILAAEAAVNFYRHQAEQKSLSIARAALTAAEQKFQDVLIVDTAGRLATDTDRMEEMTALSVLLNPAETLFVVDAMTGQDAVISAQGFADALTITGIILAKADADSRGGAALSARATIDCPIKFMGVGERIDAFEAFHPDRIASRILGMGDMMSLLEEAEEKIDKTKAERLITKVKKGQRFDLYDFREQLRQLDAMGGIDGLMSRLPGGMDLQNMVGTNAVLKKQHSKHFEAMIASMTPAERRRPEMIAGSRKRRIANGSGRQIQDVNRLLKQHKIMQKAAKKMQGAGGMKKLAGRLASASQPQQRVGRAR